MCYPDKYGRPSSFCLVPLGILCILIGGGLVGTWVGCYFECVRGKEVEYNYYAAVWTGGLAVFSGAMQLWLACFWNRCLKYFLVIFNVVLVLCCLLSAALYSYVTYLENEVVLASERSPSIGVVLTALQAVLAAFILFFVMVWGCVISCYSVDDQSDPYDDRGRSGDRERSRGRDNRGQYEHDFFNREPAIYRDTQSQYQERPQEVSYGQAGGTNTSAGYIIPRASVKGAGDMGHYSSNGRAGGAMVVDGREPRAFYSGAPSSRFSSAAPTRGQNGYAHQNGGALPQPPTGNSMGRPVREPRSRSEDRGSNQYSGRGINLMQMHGVAPASTNITDGYY